MMHCVGGNNFLCGTGSSQHFPAVALTWFASHFTERKRRAVSPTAFGEALDAFLGADQEDSEDETKGISSDPVQTEAAEKPERSAAAKVATSSSTAPIFSLAPSVRSRISSASLSAKAARVALEERRAREARWRVKDVIGAWGQPGQRPGEDDEADETEESTSALDWQQQGGTKGYERKLRKVAQRGVVKLFNAIRAAQSTTRDDLPDSAPARDSGAAAAKAKSGLASAAADRDGGNVAGRNALGGKSRELAELSKANFLDLIRTSGGSASGRATATAR